MRNGYRLIWPELGTCMLVDTYFVLHCTRPSMSDIESSANMDLGLQINLSK